MFKFTFRCVSIFLLFFTTQLHAAYTGLTAELVSENSIPGYSTYRIYANFSSPDDQLVSVTGYEGGAIFINTTGDFYQNDNGGGLATSIDPTFFAQIPDLQYDSWLTIGGEDNSLEGLNSIALNLNDFEAGGNFLINTDPGGGLYVLPNSTPEAFPDAQGRVLLAQLTANNDIEVQLNIQWRDGNEVSTNEIGETVEQTISQPSAYDGLSYELVANDEIPGFDTYRIYANFSSPEVQLITVYGQDANPLELSTTGTFYQNELGGPLSTDITEASISLDPDLAYDSWVTIGTEQAPNGLTTLGVDFIDFEAGNAILVDDMIGGGWFVLPDSEPLAFPDAQGRILLAQVTTNGTTTFSCGLQHRASDGTSFESYDSITFPDELFGCTDEEACNYNPAALEDDGSCEYNIDECGNCGGTDTSGCTDPEALNYDPDADCDDDSCIYSDSGCTYDFAINYNPFAVVDDGSCIERIDGCTDDTAVNYDASANNDDDSCIYPLDGCTDCSALNFNPEATDDDGSCQYQETCEGDFNDDGLISSSDLILFLAVFGLTCE